MSSTDQFVSIPDSIRPYLGDEKFAGSIDLPMVSGPSAIESRQSLLEKVLTGRSVVHVGCVDHLEVVGAKLASGNWLHGMLTEWSSRCIGVDVNPEGIDALRREYGIEGLYCHDVVSDEALPEIAETRWDAMLLGEVLEHIGNPVEFLTVIRRKYEDVVSQLIVTVPNAFRYENWRGVLAGRESINTDHRFWLTPFTGAKLLADAGFGNISFCFVESYAPTKLSFSRLVKHVWPATRNTIVFQATF